MSFIVVAGGVMLVFFVLALLRPGRFGPTVLALGAGYVLAQFWAEELAVRFPVVNDYVPFLTAHDALYGTMIVLPGVLALLLVGKQKSLLPRLIAALLLGVFVLALLIPILAFAVVLEPQGRALYMTAQQYQGLAVTSGLLLGLFDTLFSRLPKSPRQNKS